MKKTTLIVLLLIISGAQGWAQRPKQNPTEQFTLLMVISSLVVAGLWLMVWLKRKKNSK